MRAKLWEQLHNTLFLWQNWRGGCWEHEIEEEREEWERKSERVPEGGWKEESKKGEEEKVEGKEQGIEEEEKRRERELGALYIAHPYMCFLQTLSCHTLCLLTQDQVYSHVKHRHYVLRLVGGEHGQEVCIILLSGLYPALWKLAEVIKS